MITEPRNFHACLFERARGDWRARRRLGEPRTSAPGSWLTDYLLLYGRSASYWTLASRRLDVRRASVRLFCPTHPPWCRARAVLARVQAAGFGLQPRRSSAHVSLFPFAITAPAIAGAGVTRDSTTTRSPSIRSTQPAAIWVSSCTCACALCMCMCKYLDTHWRGGSVAGRGCAQLHKACSLSRSVL